MQGAVLDLEMGRGGGCECAEAGSKDTIGLCLSKAGGTGAGEGGVRGRESGV